MKLHIVGLIQARMGSTRLPGKVLLPLCDRPMIWHIYDRLCRTVGVDEVVVATSDNSNNDPLEAFADEMGIKSIRVEGENDIAARLSEAIRQTNADAILKVNGDCPMVDPEVMGLMVTVFKESQGLDYVSNKIDWSYPQGLSAEVISRRSLEWCGQNLTIPSDREYVADWIKTNADKFASSSIRHDSDLSKHHWAVDELEDYNFAKKVFEALYVEGQSFGMRDVLEFIDGMVAK